MCAPLLSVAVNENIPNISGVCVWETCFAYNAVLQVADACVYENHRLFYADISVMRSPLEKSADDYTACSRLTSKKKAFWIILTTIWEQPRRPRLYCIPSATKCPSLSDDAFSVVIFCCAWPEETPSWWHILCVSLYFLTCVRWRDLTVFMLKRIWYFVFGSAAELAQCGANGQ